MPKERVYYTIPSRLSWQKIEKTLGYRREYPTQKVVETGSPCGLADGVVYWRIYSTWTEGVGNSSIHICRHSNGVCILGSLRVEVDARLVLEAYNKLRVLNV